MSAHAACRASARAWRRASLADVTLKITKGTTPTTIGGRFVEQGINFLKVESITEDGALEREKLAQIDEESDELLRRSRLEENDVLFSIAGAIGRTYLVRFEDLPANVNQALAIVRFDADRMHPKYGYYAMRDGGFQGEALGRVVQCAQANVNLAQLSQSAISIPPLAEQQRIANVLFVYDELIENNRRRMKLLEDAARHLYQEWFVRLRFPGHERTRIVDGLPEGWERKRLGDIAAVNRTTLPSSFDGEIEYVDIASVVPGHITETTRFPFREAPSRARRVVQHGDVIWSCVRPNRRSHAVIWNPPENLIVSTGFAVLTPTGVPTSFLYLATTTDAFVGYLENHARGAAYPAVVAADFERADVLVPPEVLLSAFDDTIEPTFSQIHNLGLQNQKLRVARDLLLPRLMSGEIVV